jgi:L-amino acid N-acyltransferase YncA
MQIRHADPRRDAGACLEIYAPFVTDSSTSFETTPPTLAEFATRIERLAASHAFLVATDGDGTLAGFAYAGPHRERAAYRWAADVSVYLGEHHRGKGIGKQLYTVLFDLLRRQRIRVAVAGITQPNEASMALHRACGFELVGTYRKIGWKAGAWRDVTWLQLELAPAVSDGTDPPPDPGPPTKIIA